MESILALQQASRATKALQLAIMTSGDTHELTQKLLEDNGYFGMTAEQITLLKQEKVLTSPCHCAASSVASQPCLSWWVQRLAAWQARVKP